MAAISSPASAATLISSKDPVAGARPLLPTSAGFVGNATLSWHGSGSAVAARSGSAAASAPVMGSNGWPAHVLRQGLVASFFDNRQGMTFTVELLLCGPSRWTRGQMTWPVGWIGWLSRCSP